MTPTNHRVEILMKEMDMIQKNIHNLDNIIFRMKNFAFAFWGGALYLITEHLTEGTGMKTKWYLACTAVIPVVFWIIHTRWQRHIDMSSKREKMISYFINSPAFTQWIAGDPAIQFPLYDICGWIYTTEATEEGQKKTKESKIPTWDRFKIKIEASYLLDHSDGRWWKLLFYKDAAWYYPIMLLFSIGFAVVY